MYQQSAIETMVTFAMAFVVLLRLVISRAVICVFRLLDSNATAPPGSVLLFRSYALAHYITSYTGTRVSAVRFMNQSVVTYYEVEINQKLYKTEDMPEFYQKRQ